MKRIFPWMLLIVLMLLITKIFDMGISYVRPQVNLPPISNETIQMEMGSTSVDLLSRLNLDNKHMATSSIPAGFLPVVRIIDGDTIDVMEGDVKVRVRLIGINTPETVDPRRIVQCFGVEASEKTKELLSGEMVRLENDKTQDTYDKYRRRLAYVFTPDGTMVNLELIQQGYAYEYTYRTPYEHQAEFKQAERDAREGERGLWAKGACDIVSSNVLPK